MTWKVRRLEYFVACPVGNVIMSSLVSKGATYKKEASSNLVGIVEAVGYDGVRYRQNRLELLQSERHSIDGRLLLHGRLIVRVLHLVGRWGSTRS